MGGYRGADLLPVAGGIVTAQSVSCTLPCSTSPPTTRPRQYSTAARPKRQVKSLPFWHTMPIQQSAPAGHARVPARLPQRDDEVRCPLDAYQLHHFRPVVPSTGKQPERKGRSESILVCAQFRVAFTAMVSFGWTALLSYLSPMTAKATASDDLAVVGENAPLVASTLAAAS